MRRVITVEWWVTSVALALYEIAVGTVFFIIGLSWWLDPQGTAMHSPVITTTVWQWYWSTAYLICAPLGIIARLFNKIQWRAAFLVVLSSAMTMHGTVAVAHNPGDLRSYAYWVFAAAGFLRVFHIFLLRRRGVL